MEYLNAFLCGGVLCAIGQILIDKTKLTPARILTGYVVAGVILSAVGLYQPIADWGGAGATVPLTGFGHALAKGVENCVENVQNSSAERNLPVTVRLWIFLRNNISSKNLSSVREMSDPG